MLKSPLSIDTIRIYSMLYFFSSRKSSRDSREKKIKDWTVFIAFVIKKYQWLACEYDPIDTSTTNNAQEREKNKIMKENHITRNHLWLDTEQLNAAIVTANYST